MDSYWDLYVAYVNKCVRDNWINDIDPNHYQMEWNHWLPKAAFPDLPLGQWLTKKQHAIASALQTLALKENCMCGWHKKYLPSSLYQEVWSYYIIATSKAGKKSAELGNGFRKPGQAKLAGGKSGEKTKDLGIGIHAEGMASLGGRTAVLLGKGIHAPGQKRKGALVANSQVWESTEDGFRSNAGAVATHNIRRGWDPDARVRVS
jgi:hypothetical protein